MKKYSIMFFVTLVFGLFTNAKVTLPQILSDGMIVQRGVPVVLWGEADPSEIVNIQALRDGKSKSYAKAETTVTANDDGKWRAELPAMLPGSTYTITINDLTLKDVTPGDVYLCSGQSNMELPVNRVMDMFAEEINSYSNPNIREFAVPHEVEFHTPLPDVHTSAWREINADNALNFSALCYFFGKQLYEKTGVPVGLIRSCWGGTPVEAWISEESIQPFDRALNEKRLYEDDDYRAHIKKVEEENFYRWNKVMDSADAGLNSDIKWYSPSFDDSQWQDIDLLSQDWGIANDIPVNGAHWFRKDIEIPQSIAGSPSIIRMGCIVDVDSVYVNGIFVGSTGYQYPPRIYRIPEGVLHEGINNVTVRVVSQNGVPHFVPEKPYKIIASDEEVSLEGLWKYHLGTAMVPGPSMEFYQYKPVVLYNAMINPLKSYPVSAVVWYQGESNVGRDQEYIELLEALIADWRKAFNNPSMPFYIVELADFLHPSDVEGRNAWARMREAQAHVADETEGAILIKNSDLGEWNDIHPLDKKTLGARIAEAAYSDLVISPK